MNKTFLKIRNIVLLIANLAVTLGHTDQVSNLEYLDLSPEKYGALLTRMHIADVFVQTIFLVEPALASVKIERLEFLSTTGDFLISTGTGGATMIQQLQEVETPEELPLSPALAWINGSTFSFNERSNSWHKMSHPNAPSLSLFRLLDYESMSEVSHLKKQLLIKLENSSKRAKGDRLIIEGNKLLEDIESDARNQKEFFIANERYLVKIAPSGLVERLTVFEDDIVKKVIINVSTNNSSQSIKDLVRICNDNIEGLSKSEADLFQKLAGKPSYGIFLAPREEGYVVVTVDPRGPSYQAGLRKDDIITRIDGKLTSEMQSNDLRLLLSESDQVIVSFTREGMQMQNVAISKRAYIKDADLKIRDR